ncbi:hypothetical protein, variant [Exophiala xenobiotica]|uniref:Uncharacterized protein n=1 Tax=Exophiala xenobiotica TaxID=348802 RepID=A0A0D2BZC6_9EURO|nr:hypothetical protein, variant [Exophiala xenobiotica]KIW57806.1 hypothetical protein, variant [Exophiala xenobiotica]
MTRLFACSLLQANQEGSCKVMTKILGHWPCKMTCCSVVRLEETSGVGIWIPGACEVRDTLCSTYWASFDHRRLERSMTGHTKTVRCLGFVDSGTAISASSDTTLKIWDLGSGACKTTFSGHTSTIRALVFTEELAISGDGDGTCLVWSLPQHRRLATLTGHSAAICSIAFDGQRIFTGSADQDVRVWDTTTETCVFVMKGHTSLVTHVQIHDNLLVTSGADGRIVVWSREDYGLLHIIHQAHEFGVVSLEAENGYVLSGSSDGTVKLWHLESATLVGAVGKKAEAVWMAGFGKGQHENIVVALKEDDAFLDVWPFSP